MPDCSTEFQKRRSLLDWLDFGDDGAVLSPEFTGRFPRTSKLLENLGQFCAAAHANDSWFNVGNSCRETFQMFVEELRQHGRMSSP
jgi:hypothetical protein